MSDAGFHDDFHRDNEWQRERRDAVLVPELYGKYAAEGRYVKLDKGRFATLLQRRHAVDTVVQRRNGSAVFIEEKLVRWPGRHYRHFCLETESCSVPGYQSHGWMHYGEADLLLYGFCQPDGGIRVHLMDFPQLKNWFWARVDEFPTFGPLKTLNASAGRLVPISAVRSKRTPVRHWYIEL